MTPDLITVRAGATRLGISHATMYRWITSDHPPKFAIMVNKHWKVSVPLLDAYILGN